MESKQEIIDETEVHYKLYGSGPVALLLIHSAVGSANDFRMQMDESLGFSKQEFTVVAFDLPGYGRSAANFDEQLKRDPTRAYFETCADLGAKLMSKLNFKTYAVGGWSDGARVASLLAAKHVSRVDALVLWGFVPVMDRHSCEAIARIRDTGVWEPEALRFYTSVYGDENFSELWRKYVDFVVRSLEMPDQLDIREDLSNIKCPTLILHGALDPIVSFEEHIKPLEYQIYDSQIVTFKKLAHNIHQSDPSEFNRVFRTFVTSVRVA